MSKMISECPACGAKLRITSLRCADCGMELRNDFELSPFDSLNQEQKDFLIAFLKQRGNMSSVQNELGISYLTAKKRLDDLLEALNLVDENQKKTEYEGAIDMSTWYVQKDSNKASDIIKRKLMENGGRVVVRLMKGSPCEIIATPDGESFVTDKIQNKKLPYRYEVIDVIVNLLIAQGGQARKGNARYKLGEPKCDEATVAGAIGYNYFHAETGKSVYDPVFVLAAVLEWAGIAKNGRRELVLTDSYRESL